MGNRHHFHHFGPVSTSDRMLYFNSEKGMCTMWKGKVTSRHVSQRIAKKAPREECMLNDVQWLQLIWHCHHARLQDIICTMRSVTSNMSNIICTMHQHTEQPDMLMKIPSAFHTRHDAVVCLRYCIIRVCSGETGDIIPQVKGQQWHLAYHTADYAFL